MAVQRFVVIQAGKLSVERWLNQIEKGRRNCYFFYACKRGWMKLTRLEIYNKKDINLGLLIQEKTFSYTPPTCSWTRYCEDNTLLGFTKMVHIKSNVLVNEPNL